MMNLVQQTFVLERQYEVMIQRLGKEKDNFVTWHITIIITFGPHGHIYPWIELLQVYTYCYKDM